MQSFQKKLLKLFLCVQLRANALIKRGSMYMQQQQPQLSTQDFNMAAEMDPRNADVFHHRGQVFIKLQIHAWCSA